MSRARKARRHKRRPASPPAGTPSPSGVPAATAGSRLTAAQRRAGLAKVTFGAGGALAFSAVMLLARHSYAGHPKSPARPLSAPPRFVTIVHDNLLQAGIVAPAQAPPGASTSVS